MCPGSGEAISREPGSEAPGAGRGVPVEGAVGSREREQQGPGNGSNESREREQPVPRAGRQRTERCTAISCRVRGCTEIVSGHITSSTRPAHKKWFISGSVQDMYGTGHVSCAGRKPPGSTGNLKYPGKCAAISHTETRDFVPCDSRRYTPNLTSIPKNVTTEILLLMLNDIKELTNIPEMPNLTLLDLSYNRLRTFPWSSLKNAPTICKLKLNNNEISKVDAYVDFPQTLEYLYLQCNRITTIPETFLHGLKPRKETFYLRIWQNPLLCDCKIQWIARFRRCVWEHRQEGCVNASPGRARKCIQDKCNFHPNGVAVILDWLQKTNKLTSVKPPTPGQSLRCDSPQELKGTLLRNISLPTCTSANDSANSQQTSSTDKLETREPQKPSAETEPPTLVTNTWERTTVNTPKLSLFWKRLISGILGGALALFVAAFIIRCISHCRKRRRACFNNMASAPTLPTRTGNRLQMIVSVDQSDSTVDGHRQCSPSVHSRCKPDPHVNPKSTSTALPLQTVSTMSVSKVVNVDQGQSSNDTLSPSVHSLCKPDPQINPKSTATALPLQTVSKMSVSKLVNVDQGQTSNTTLGANVHIDTRRRRKQSAGQVPNLKTIPKNVTVKSLLLNTNDIEELTNIPEMPKLFLLDLSFNRLRRFPWSSLKNASNILHLKLNNNEISKVDAYVDFPQSLTYLHLQFNRITTIAESFLHGFKSQKQTFYLRIWQNPLLCDCKIQWIARLRRCVWEHRDEGCVNASPVRVMKCILAKCNFHPNGVAVILDWLQLNDQAIVKQRSSEEFLRCDSPQELKGNLLRDVSLPTCAAPNSSGSPQQTSSPDNLGIHESEKVPTETEPPTLVIYSWERSTGSQLASLAERWLFWL
ncbi:hypothetical protein Bbelb_142290 [Branchiostoma belcheri]|nr:hypothetical protein Bbelb_142290 [Branchiostoma belcheri]